MAGSYSNPRFTILRNFHYLFQSGCIILHSHYQRECSSFPISLPYYCLTFENHHPSECDVVSHCGLICIPLMTKAGEGNGTPLQYSCMENPMDGGAWWAAVHGVARSRTWLSDFTFTHWRRKWQLTPVFLPGESQGRGSLVGFPLWGLTELDTTEAT